MGAASAEFYARRAAVVFGGEPVILRVIVDWDDLSPDPDDEDIASGAWQFVTSAPVRVVEVDGEKVAL